jgi:hypothetical protein
MDIHATLPPRGRDLRLDFFRGIANWAIFLDHIPNNVVNWITTRNYGFSDAADLFVFISGYTASFVYAKMMLDRGFVVGATRLFKRVWQLYVAHVVLFVIYIAAIGYVAQRFHDADIVNEFNIAGFIDNPIQTLSQGLLLRFKPLNLDVLPLYIVLMAVFPPVLWMMLRRPDITMLGSLLLYFAARQFGWNLHAYPEGYWYFNPFAWQLLFMFGAWFALGGATESRSIINSRVLLYFGIAYLVFALIMTMAGRFDQFGAMFPRRLYDAFNPNDKTNLAPYRVLHFVIIAFFVTRFVSRDWAGLRWRIMQPIIKCGQQSLAVFCVGVFLSFVAHFVLSVSSGSLFSQVVVSAMGIVILTVMAYYISWSKQQDKAPPRPAIAPPASATTAATSLPAGQQQSVAT